MNHATQESAARRADLERALAVTPNDPDLLIEYGVLLFDPFHESEASRAALEHAVRVKPEDSRILFWLAKLAVHRELDDAKAKALLERALGINPECAECLSLLISVLSDDHLEMDRCASLARRLVQVAPDWPRAHEMKAQIAKAQGHVAEAREEYGKALRLSELPRNENLPSTYFEIAVTGRHPTAAAIERIKTALAGLSR